MRTRRHSGHGPGAFVLLGALVVVLLVASACRPSTPASAPPQSGTTQPVAPSSPTSEATKPPASPPGGTTSQPVAQTTVRVYLVRGEYLGVGTGRKAPVTAPARTAMTQLLLGPTASEKSMGLRSQIPRGTRLLGLSIASGTATVNLSKRFESGGGTLTMTLRVAQVVNTLTQFRGVTKVAFRIGGKPVDSIGGEGVMVSPPVSRSDFESSLPAIMLEGPLPASTIGNPVRITGSADVFEAQFRVRVTDAAGKVVADKPVMATSGTGTRGKFSALVAYKKSAKHGRGSITVYEPSAKDGSETNVVKIPVNL